MSEHTPIPQIVLEEDDIFVATPSGIVVARMSVHKDGSFGLSYEEQLSRAHSYCATDDLLAACQLFERWDASPHNTEADAAALRSAIHSAITKAKGTLP